MTAYRFPSFETGALTLIVGLGETGVAAALWCAQQGERLRVLDTREQPGGLAALTEKLQTAGQQAEFLLGVEHFGEAALEGVQRLVLSPGLSPLAEPVRTLLSLAEARGIAVQGEIELFALALRDLREQGYQPKVLAVTGTNGKTTVTSMVRALVEASAATAMAAGNISPAALAALSRALEQEQLPQVWVLELSSFQLHTTHSLALDAAVVLNVTQDHLDWHGDMSAYAAAKQQLLTMAQVAVLNRDDAWCREMVADLCAANVRSFGQGLPELEGDLGLEDDHGLTWLSAAEALDMDAPRPAPRRRRKGAEPEAELRQAGRVTRMMPSDALFVRGRHNALNALAALALGKAIGLTWGDMLRALRSYEGEPHRTRFVRVINDVTFVDDSKATNVGATQAALDGLDHKVVLIAGGVGKGQDFSPLAPLVMQHARAVVLMGRDQDALAAVLQTETLTVVRVASMEEAVRQSFALAQPGDAVLLSPACASLDMFRDYAHRGQVFADAVHELALERGEVA
ncbi:UDP-N-acetylmuramoyl-L-alanine--D-glutamate ligase [Pusillimonas sp. CC-YST705]|uniref:UDP-N-acetylmuramoylalanine--D-glutamate ligase n=1 Tax=Mesopusillimonas faecipullorum TaxID=2755040 RepID=A0ABS8C998_9BURK|nr:UDP-N-acetylmuramoyl-L-alanine--D-glutamate ligase [Mesopusillimonas faecipullorum]MCB5362606.1 UDP-N-acetylmuramoyl-L-alanine--D-glutamate ligase [Mesopusillimonas faecipullorum]